MKGIMTKKYHAERKTKLASKYRLRRRTREVLKIINKYLKADDPKILDLGTADGLMLSEIKKQLPKSDCVGIELSKELIESCRDKNIKIVQGDVQNLPFKDESFDIVIATAIIEHLDHPMKLLEEAHRVLRPGGILILTTPNPFFEKIADFIGHTEKEIHQTTFGLKKLKTYFKKTNFQILETKRFMISPIGLPCELTIEKIIRFLKLGFILLNQLVVGKKK